MILPGSPAVRMFAVSDNSDSCIDTCKWNTCHDGWPYQQVTDATNSHPLEACDDGNTTDTDACVGACVVNVCGDGSASRGTRALERLAHTPGRRLRRHDQTDEDRHEQREAQPHEPEHERRDAIVKGHERQQQRRDLRQRHAEK